MSWSWTRTWRQALPAISAALTALAPATATEIPTQGAGTAFMVTQDNEGFSSRRLALEYLPVYRHGDSLTGVRYTDLYYEQENWARNGKQLTVLHRDIDPATARGWQVEGGVSRQGGRHLLSLEGNYHLALAKQTALELFVNRDWVETRTALDQGAHFTFVGASLEQGLGPHVTLVGVAGYQDFSDGNHRQHGRVKLIVQPDLDLGLTLQARYRMYLSARDDVGGAYFNPDRYDETMLALGWRHRIRGWMGNLTAGIGQQRVADAARTPTRLLEIAIQAPPSLGHTVRVRGGLSRSASFNGPDYSYRYLQAEWILAF